MKNTIGIIGAMDSEIAYLTSVLKNSSVKEICGLIFHSGKIDGKDVVIVRSGIGKVNAARCAQAMIDLFNPSAIINTGIAGAIDPALNVGDIVIASDLVQHDFDVRGLGYAKGYLFSGNETDKPTLFHADKDLVCKIEKAAVKHADPKRIYKGIIASGDVFVSSPEVKSEIRDTFSATAAEMEGAAIAHTAAYSNVPFAVLRVMSDKADGSASVSMKEFEAETAKLSASIIETFIKDL